MELTKASFVGKLIEFIYPPRCLLCQQPGIDKLDICVDCYARLPWNTRSCKQCAIPLVDKNEASVLCGRCQKKAPFFDATYSIFRYEADIVNMVHQFKFHQRLAFGRLLGALILHKIQNLPAKPDCILPVPLFKSRLRQRGFNQSIELAKVLSRSLQIPVLTDRVVRTRNTETQTGLNAKQRRKNIKGAFEIVEPVLVKHVAIVDDVITTASTVNELARVLKRGGIERVDVYSVARA